MSIRTKWLAGLIVSQSLCVSTPAFSENTRPSFKTVAYYNYCYLRDLVKGLLGCHETEIPDPPQASVTQVLTKFAAELESRAESLKKIVASATPEQLSMFALADTLYSSRERGENLLLIHNRMLFKSQLPKEGAEAQQPVYQLFSILLEACKNPILTEYKTHHEFLTALIQAELFGRDVDKVATLLTTLRQGVMAAKAVAATIH